MSQYVETAAGSVEGKTQSFVRCPKCIVAAMLVAVVFGAAALVVANREPPAPQAQSINTQVMTDGFEYGAESTPGHVASPGVTSEYGFEYGAESTPGHVASPGVTSEYFGYSGELWPATTSASQSVLDPIETRSVSSQVGAGSGSILVHGALDPFETRAAASQTNPVVEAGSQYPKPEYR